MGTDSGPSRIDERKLKDREARRARIVSAARRIAEQEGWPNVTVRRLSDEIAYSQPVLYGHFESREAIVSAVAIEGFEELGAALERARTRAGRGSSVAAVAAAYLEFAEASPALYEAMFSMRLNVAFDEAATPPALHFAFTQVAALFDGESTAKREVRAELLWASLHGLAELTRTGRLPRSRQRVRLRLLVELFRPEG